jgi:hypothetical protein
MEAAYRHVDCKRKIDDLSPTCEYDVFEYFAKIYGEFLPYCHLFDAGWPKSVIVRSLVLVSAGDREFHLILEKEARSGDRPSLEHTDGRVEPVSKTVVHLSRPRRTLYTIHEWGKGNLSPQDEMTAFIMNVSVPRLSLISVGLVHFGGDQESIS